MDSQVTRRQPLLSLFAVAVTGALLALTERAAYAVPPTLDVSPKPPICVTRPGTVLASVNYNLNGADKAIPNVRDDTDPAQPKDLINKAASGGKPLSVEWNHVYRARLISIRNVDLAPPVQITTKNCDIPTPYTQNCFGVEVGIKRHGTFADFVLAASKPVTWDLKASKQPPLNGQLLGTDTTMSSAALQSTWVNPLLGLEAATDYFCVITATDAMNNAEAPWSTSVNIKTLNGKALTEDLFFEVYVTVSVSYK